MGKKILLEVEEVEVRYDENHKRESYGKPGLFLAIDGTMRTLVYVPGDNGLHDGVGRIAMYDKDIEKIIKTKE